MLLALAFDWAFLSYLPIIGAIVGLFTLMFKINSAYQKKKEQRFKNLKPTFELFSDNLSVRTIDIGRKNFPRVTYDDHEFKAHANYDEIIKHLVIDIPDFLSKYQHLEKSVMDFDSFILECDIKIRHYITTICTRYGFSVTYDESHVPKIDTISTTSFLDFLVPFWLKGHDFNHRFEEHHLILQGGTTVGTLTATADIVDRFVQDLRNNEDILSIITNFKASLAKITKLSNEISKAISDVSTRIETGDYDTKCEYCRHHLTANKLLFSFLTDRNGRPNVNE